VEQLRQSPQRNGAPCVLYTQYSRGTKGTRKICKDAYGLCGNEDVGQMSAENGNDIVVTTLAAYYFDYLNLGNKLDKIYEYEPVPVNFTPVKSVHILGIQANLWSEWIPNFKRLQYQAFPRMFAVSATRWVAKGDKDFEAFNKRVEKQYDCLEALNVYYYIPAVEGLERDIAFVDMESIMVNLSLAYSLEGVEIYYTLEGSVPSRNSLKYNAPFVVKDTREIKARAYRGPIFNDLKTARIIQKKYTDSVAVIPQNGGLKRWITKGKFNRVEDIISPSGNDWFKVAIIELGKFKGHSDFSMIYQGYFKAEADAIYEFQTQSDGGGLLYIGRDLVVDNGGYHGPRKPYGKLALKKGWHPILVHYKPSSNPQMINVHYAMQGEPFGPVDSKVISF